MCLHRLSFNSYYLHHGLDKLGLMTYGYPSSPIVPLLIFSPAKMVMFQRMMKDCKTPIITVVLVPRDNRLFCPGVRFCVSVSHTKEDIDDNLRACNELGEVFGFEAWG
ncbi:hypothetical protein GYMLUDRAFT_265064 [Collybiopsis luxurians FD-317 M1]|uniref:Uncharacterized protein n=1 Tax=Collybiopsis luxurians FD-317 M1 TaxID=944289 RepID=A0A0D0BUU4_9AGAR|nr:hypothetical protein GYMLUDRAFT_265064 [Collybiopsis luxurians FD-317 M1]